MSRGARPALAAMQLTITANPLALDDETVLERVLMIAAGGGCSSITSRSSASKGASRRARPRGRRADQPERGA